MNEVLTDTHPNMGRVLLVDDEPDQVALLRAMLTPLGMDVSTAESAEQALAAYRRQPVDVVVTDLHLPGASGIDLIRQLRRLRESSCRGAHHRRGVGVECGRSAQAGR